MQTFVTMNLRQEKKAHVFCSEKLRSLIVFAVCSSK